MIIRWITDFKVFPQFHRNHRKHLISALYQRCSTVGHNDVIAAQARKDFKSLHFIFRSFAESERKARRDVNFHKLIYLRLEWSLEGICVMK